MSGGNEGRITDTVIAVAGLGLLAYEAWTLVNRRKGDTISESVWRVTVRRPLVPFAVGLLVGHLFWQKNDEAR